MRKNSTICEKCIYKDETEKAYCELCHFEQKGALDDIIEALGSLNNDLLDAIGGLDISPEDEDESDEWDDEDADDEDSDEDNDSEPFDDGRLSFNWLKGWKEAATDPRFKKHGIILTNSAKCRIEQRSEFIAIVDKYINYKAENGIKYYLLDLSDGKAVTRSSTLAVNDPQFIVNILRQAYDLAPIEYLMIIGDRNVVGSAKWKNGLHSGNGFGDSDEYVDSDLPYVLLENRSLFDGKTAKRSIKVGRVPASGDWGFVTAQSYLSNVMRFHKERRDLNSITMSATEWGNVTRNIYSGISPLSYDCPPYSFVEGRGDYNISRDFPYDLMCFNLHGSPMHNAWQSGDGTIGMSSASLPTHAGRLYVLGSEACYGAKPIIKRTTEQSILITALRNNCLGFLGSTQIAYGITDRLYSIGAKPLCADIMVSKFADLVHGGCALGDAYIEAWDAVSRSSNDLESTKTLCSFALYGDPTATLASPSKIKIASKGKTMQLQKPFVNITSKMRPADVLKSPFHTVDRFIKEKLPEYSGKVVGVYKVQSSHNHKLRSNLISYNKNGKECKEYKATYENKENGITSVLQVYFNEKGDIDRVYVSK